MFVLALQEASRASRASQEQLEAQARATEDVSGLQQALLKKDAELCKIRQEINEMKKENEVCAAQMTTLTDWCVANSFQTNIATNRHGWIYPLSAG